jgi:chemotaxis signal transduction protein
MPLLSPLRSRRFAQQEHLKNQQTFITFQLGSHSFGLPILQAQRVLAWQDIQVGHGNQSVRLGASHRSESPERTIPLLDVSRLLLGKHLPFQPQALILLLPPAQEEVGLPIPTQPILRRLSLAQIQSVPNSHATQARQRGIVQWVPGASPHLFLIDPNLWFAQIKG